MSDDVTGLGLGPEWYSTAPEPAERTPPSSGGGHDGQWGDEPPIDEPSYWDGDPGWDSPPGEYLDDAPPVGEAVGGDLDQAGAPAVSYRSWKPRMPDAGDAGDPERVRRVLRLVLASLNGEPAEVVSATVARVTRERDVLDRVPDGWRPVIDGVLEVLAFECTALDGVGVVNFDFMPGAWNHTKAVRDELELLSGLERSDNPSSEFEALVEAIQAGMSRQAALILVREVDDQSTAARKMKAFREIPPPTRQREVVNNTWAKSAAQWMDEARAAEGAASELILSSGYPTLDMAAAGSGDLPGLIRPGEFWVGGAGTGHGKSAFTRRVFSSMLLDLVYGWGLQDALGILGFTEEEAWDVATAAMLDKGQPYHAVANNAILAKLGESRKRVVEVVYDAVIAAAKKADSTGAPITDFLPYFYFLDYIQAIKEPGENPDTEGVARTADLMMRGIAAWDPEMMGSISGVSFEEYAGMRWPDGMDNHRVAVFCLSQLRKEGNDHTVFYRSGKSTISDFTVVDANGTPMWEPLEDDYAIPNRSDLRGSGVLLNHATGLIFFHRSRPTASVRKDPVTGRKSLTDTRARFIVPKARKSVSMPYIPVRFDSNPEGFRGMFYDDLAWQHAVVEGRMEVMTEWCTRPGDPILPRRPKRSPWDIRY